VGFLFTYLLSLPTPCRRGRKKKVPKEGMGKGGRTGGFFLLLLHIIPMLDGGKEGKGEISGRGKEEGRIKKRGDEGATHAGPFRYLLSSLFISLSTTKEDRRQRKGREGEEGKGEKKRKVKDDPLLCIFNSFFSRSHGRNEKKNDEA